mmetsp:Transcript_2553/g.7411  ORF Transcript_2553/g.7411 Transcript_2553/m.7411 type:complete len:235 (+) Transcript_2553:229-933(+)
MAAAHSEQRRLPADDDVDPRLGTAPCVVRCLALVGLDALVVEAALEGGRSSGSSTARWSSPCASLPPVASDPTVVCTRLTRTGAALEDGDARTDPRSFAREGASPECSLGAGASGAGTADRLCSRAGPAGNNEDGSCSTSTPGARWVIVLPMHLCKGTVLEEAEAWTSSLSPEHNDASSRRPLCACMPDVGSSDPSDRVSSGSAPAGNNNDRTSSAKALQRASNAFDAMVGPWG